MAKAAVKKAAKPVARKAPAKKVVAKKVVAKKASAAPRAAKAVSMKVVTGRTPQKTTAIKEAYSKTQTLTEIAGATGLTRKQVGEVINELSTLVQRHVKDRNAAGKFTLPGLFKIEIKRKPATKARKGRNPFTGEETMFKAKPARNVVKVRALKKLKDMVS
jgi:nucleoid DNA-binding protein